MAAWFRTPLRAAAARCRDAGAAGQRHARSAVRVRAGGHRRVAAARRSSSARTRSIRSMKARRCWPAPSRCSSTRPRANGFDLDLDSLADDEVAAHAADLRLLAGQSDRPRARRSTTGARCSTAPIATASSSRPTSAIRRSIPTRDAPPLGGLEAAQRLGRDGFPQSGGLHQPVEAIERAGAAFGRRRRRRRPAAAVSALSHVSWMRDESRRAARQHRRLERRGARARQPRAVPREVRRRRADARAGAAGAAAGRRVLSVGAACRAATTRRLRGSCLRRRT